VLDTFARFTEAYEEDRHLISKDRLYEIRYEDLVKDPVGAMRGIYEKLGIAKFDEAEGPMRAIFSDRSDHRVSSYSLPRPVARRIAERLGPFIDRYGYRDAVDAVLKAEPAADGRG